MKISELLNESANYDDWDQEEEIPTDPEQDKVPNIVFQFKKSLDVGGRYPILFRDGTKANIPTNIMLSFLKKYGELKPMDRKTMQDMAVQSIDKLKEVLSSFKGQPREKSIYI
jgi:hypothetical protein